MKNPALKRKRNWRNILTYLATYIVVTFSVAFVVVSFSNKTYSAGNTELKPNTSSSSALGMMVTRLMEMQDANLVLNVDADRGEDEIGLQADINLVMYPGLEGAEVNVNAGLTYNDIYFDVSLTYKDGMAYVSIGDKNYSMSASSIMSATMSVLSLCGIDIDLSGDLMSSFDMSLLDSLGEIKEEKLDNGAKLTIALNDSIKVVILTDKDYNIKNVNLDRITLSGMNVGANVVFNSTNKGTKVNVPSKEFVDVSESVGLIETLYNTVAGKKFGFNFDAFESQVSVALDLENNSMQAKVNALDNDFALTFKDNKIYLDAGVLKLKSDLPKFDLQQLTGVVGALSDEQADKIKTVLTKAYDAVKNINLKNITKTEYGYAVNFNDTLIKFKVVDGKVNSIEVDDTCIINLFSDVAISVADENFTNVTNLKFLLQPIKSLLNDKLFSANVELSVSDFTLNGILSVDFKDNKLVQFKAEIMGVEVMLTVTKDGVYLKADDIKVMTDFASISNVLDELKSDSDKTDINDTLQRILKKTIEFVKPSASQLDVKYGDYTISVVADAGKFDSIKIASDKLNANVKFAEEFTVEQNFEDYEKIDITKEKIESIKNAVAGKVYSFDGTVNIGDTTIDIEAKADLTDLQDIKAEAKIVAYDKKIEVNVQDNTIYVKLDGIKISGSFDEIVELINAVMDRINVVQTYSLEAPSGLEIKDIHLSLVDEEIVVSLSVNDKVISAVLDLSELSLDLRAGEVVASVAVDKASEVNTLSPAETSEYTAQATRLYDLAVSALNTAKAERVHAIATLNIAGETIEVELGLVHTDTITVKFETTFKGIKVVGYVADNKVYINVFDICFMFDLNNLDKNLNQIAEIFDLDLSVTKDIATIIETIKLNNITKFETDKNSFKLTYNDIALKVFTYNELISRVQVKYNDIDVNFSITYPNNYKIVVTNNRVIELDNLAPVGNAFYNTFKSRSISGDIDLMFDLFKETNRITVNYGVKIGENLTDISGYIKTTFKNLDINIYYIDKTFYLDVIGLKLKLKFDDIPSLVNWINENFGTDINVDKLFEDINIEDLSLDFITNAHFGDDTVTATLMDNIRITAEYTDVFNRVTFENGTTKAILNCTRFDDFTLNAIDIADFDNYTVITDIVDAIYNTAKLRQFNIVANSKVFRNNADYLNIDLNLALDIIENTLADGTKSTKLNAGGSARVSGETNVALDVNYQNEKLYVNWEGLKLSIHKNSIKEILGIVLQVLNVDTSGIPALEKIKKEFDIDTDNLGQIVPTLSNINPLNYLEYIKRIDVTDGKLQIVMNGQKLNGDPDFNPVITFEMAGGKLANVEIEKLYTGVTADENITVNVQLKDFNGVTQVSDNDYIDISNSSDIIRAFVNTSNMNDYHVNGSVIMNLKLGSLAIDAAKLSVDIKVKLDNDKKPIIAVEIGNYPLIGLVNNKNTNGVGDTGIGLINQRHRTIYIYYRDGEMYLQTSDEQWGWGLMSYKQLDRVTKVTPSYLMENLNYYMQWLLGFTDKIQSKINEAIETSNKNKEKALSEGSFDYSNIILNYVKNGNTHSFDVNIGKLAYNDDLGTLHVDLSTVNNANTGNKDYLGTINFNLDLLNSLIILKTDNNNNLKLTDIGSSVDISNALVALSDSRFQLDGEYEKEGTGKWNMANQGDRTVVLYDGETQVATLTGAIGTAINLPAYSNRVIDDGKSEKVYVFLGWFTADGTKYTSTAYPRYDTTLYTKWNLISERTYHTIEFVTNENISVESITRLNGEQINLPVLKNIEMEYDDNTSILKVFKGWYLDENFTELYTSDTMPDSDVTLYAKWETLETKTYHVSIFSAGTEVYSGKVQAGVSFEFPVNNFFKKDTLYYLDADFTTQVTNFVINNDTTWYAKNKYNYTIYSKYTTLNGAEYNKLENVYEGSTITLPTYSNYEIDNFSYTTEYHFMGWSKDGDATLIKGNTVVVAGDSSYVAVWEVKEYCVVTFNPKGWSNPAWWTITKNIRYISNSSVSGTNNNTLKVERGKSIDLTIYKATCVYGYKFGIEKKYSFETVAWAENAINLYDVAGSSQKYSGDTTMMIDSNITLQPVWKHV